MIFRPGSNDEAIWNAVYSKNEYQAPDDLSGKLIIDVGMHTGAFSRLCLERGAIVDAYEPCCANYLIGLSNVLLDLPEAPLRWNPRRLAVCGKAGRHQLYYSIGEEHSGVMVIPYTKKSTDQADVWGITLDEAIDGRPIDWLKMDSEGSEYAAVFSSHTVNLCRRVTVESHYPDRHELIRDNLLDRGFTLKSSSSPAGYPNYLVLDFVRDS